MYKYWNHLNWTCYKNTKTGEKITVRIRNGKYYINSKKNNKNKIIWSGLHKINVSPIIWEYMSKH